MKFAMLAAALLLSTGSSAGALEFRSPVVKHLFACDSKNLSRVAARPGAAPDVPGACCLGELRCAQFLATRSILKPQLDPRT